jgi:hypothetical protein
VIVGGLFQAEPLQDPANAGFESLGAQVQPGSDGYVERPTAISVRADGKRISPMLDTGSRAWSA